LKPRDETISSEGIEGIIDLANLHDSQRNKLEARPSDFFNLTYPTDDILKVLHQLALRFSSSSEGTGLFLFEGLKGSGKSHLLLLIYHLFKNPDVAAGWLSLNNISWKQPKAPLVIINKFTDTPHDSIWNMIYEALGASPHKGTAHPSLKDLKKAIGDNQIILIFDELEQGIKIIENAAL